MGPQPRLWESAGPGWAEQSVFTSSPGDHGAVEGHRGWAGNGARGGPAHDGGSSQRGNPASVPGWAMGFGHPNR